MNYRAFCNYMSTIQNAIDAEHNHHPENLEIHFKTTAIGHSDFLKRCMPIKSRIFAAG